MTSKSLGNLVPFSLAPEKWMMEAKYDQHAYIVLGTRIFSHACVAEESLSESNPKLISPKIPLALRNAGTLEMKLMAHS